VRKGAGKGALPPMWSPRGRAAVINGLTPGHGSGALKSNIGRSGQGSIPFGGLSKFGKKTKLCRLEKNGMSFSENHEIQSSTGFRRGILVLMSRLVDAAVQNGCILCRRYEMTG